MDSRFVTRGTEREPTKSGWIGLICCASGKPRVGRPGDGHVPLAVLAALRMAVRIDREGSIDEDFQIHRDVPCANGKPGENVLSTRRFLSNAVFLVGLEGEESVLRDIDDNLRDPTWPVFLGRKSFLPSYPIYLPDGLVDEPLAKAIRRYPWLPAALPGHAIEGEAKSSLRLVEECRPTDAGAVLRGDVPLSFDPLDRRFGPRFVMESMVQNPDIVAAKEDACTLAG
jgi:CRISPR system Cascade subunit CasD